MRFVLFLMTLFLLTACNDDDEPNVSDDFTVIGMWNLEGVTASAPIGSLTGTETEGCVVFNEDGTGSSFFKFVMFNEVREIGEGAITYVTDDKMPVEQVTITQTDSTEVVWTFLQGTDTSVIATFVYDYNFATKVKTTVNLSRK